MTSRIIVFIFTALVFPAVALGASLTLDPLRPRVGELASIRVTGLKLEPGERPFALLEGREFPLRDLGGKGLAGYVALERDAKAGPRNLEVVAKAGGGRRTLKSFKVRVAGRKFEEQHLKVDQKTVELSKEDAERAVRERELISGALAGRSEEWLAGAGFARPLAGAVSSSFGLRRFYNGRPGSYHGGLDIASPAGEEVHASAQGVVTLSGEYFFTGNTVFVDHGYGLFTAYFHMESRAVEAGARVARGELLGRVGSTGRSTGPHLHWSVYLCGVKVDPESLLRVASSGERGETP